MLSDDWFAKFNAHQCVPKPPTLYNSARSTWLLEGLQTIPGANIKVDLGART